MFDKIYKLATIVIAVVILVGIGYTLFRPTTANGQSQDTIRIEKKLDHINDVLADIQKQLKEQSKDLSKIEDAIDDVSYKVRRLNK